MTRATIPALAMLTALISAPVLIAAQGREGGVGITVFADRDFHGESANFRSDVTDLTKYRMNDVVSSLRVARGETWEVCVDKNFKGRCQLFTGEDADLSRTGWDHTISSMRRIRDVAAYQRRPEVIVQPRITFYDRPGFRGASRSLTGPVETLGFFSNRAGSIRVDAGEWEVCEGPRFTGRCAIVSRDVADLERFDLNNSISSARPRLR